MCCDDKTSRLFHRPNAYCLATHQSIFNHQLFTNCEDEARCDESRTWTSGKLVSERRKSKCDSDKNHEPDPLHEHLSRVTGGSLTDMKPIGPVTLLASNQLQTEHQESPREAEQMIAADRSRQS